MGDWTRRQWLITVGVCLPAVIAGAAWALWPDQDGEVRERRYSAETACLLTDEHGVTREPGRTAWESMREISVDSLVKVQHVAITGAQDPANALVFYNTLAVQRCTVIVAAGDLPAAALREGRSRFPGIEQVTVTGDPATVREQVEDLLRE